jgi:hypothetical protein
MPVGTTLLTLRQMLRAEIGENLDETASPANVTLHNRLLSTKQSWLANQHAYLLSKVRKEVALTAGTRLYTLPTGIDLDRLDQPAYTKLGNFRFWMEFGIRQEHYNAFDPTLDMRCDPVIRWDIINDAGTRKLEVWPIPASNQTMIIEGMGVPSTMTANGDLCVVDDLVLVLFTAAEILTRDKQADAQAKLSLAQAALNSLKASRPSEFETFSLSGRGRTCCTKDRPMVGVTDYSVSYIRFVNGETQLLASDGLWYSFQLVNDQGQVTIEIGQTGTL